MPATKTGSYSWQFPTDEKHVIEVESILVSSEWEKSAAYSGQEAYFQIYTAMVGHRSPITVTLKTESGNTLDSYDIEITYNRYRGCFSIPRNIEEGERIFFEVSAPALGIDGASGAIPVFAVPFVENLKWSKEEAERDDIITLSADVYNVEEKTPVEITIYEYDKAGAHEEITRIPRTVEDKQVSLQWQYIYHGDHHYIMPKEKARELDVEWEQPKYFFTVSVGATEYGKENQDSGLLNIFVELTASAHILEFEADHFRAGSALLLPSSEDDSLFYPTSKEAVTGFSLIRSILLFADANKEKKLLIAGHTASSDTKDDSFALSKDRADIIRSLIEDDKDSFGAIADRAHIVEDIQQILIWAGYDLGPVDGKKGKKTDSAIKAFQSDAGLKDDGIMGPKSFGAVFDLYQESIKSLMSDGPGKSAIRNRGGIQWAYPDNKAVGCGHLYVPAQVDKENLKSKTATWVEAVFFAPDDIPDCVCKDGACDPAGCQVYKRGMVKRSYINGEKQTLSGEYIQFQLFSECGEPYSEKAYSTEIDGVEHTENTDQAGWTRFINVSGVTEGKISYEGLTYNFKIDPEASDTIQAKSALNGLGYIAGELNDDQDEKFQGIVKQYQESAKITPTGTLDASTLESLKNAHKVPLNLESE